MQLREQSLGHYDISIVPVHIRENTEPVHTRENTEPIYSIVYYATPNNETYLGDGPLDVLADDIATSCGVVGHNIEYLFRLADFMRENLPDEKDEHLFALDRLVRVKLQLSTKNILPWLKLIECKNFRKIIYQTNTNSEDEMEKEGRNSPTAVMAQV